jgi:hypothetical protein
MVLGGYLAHICSHRRPHIGSYVVVTTRRHLPMAARRRRHDVVAARRPQAPSRSAST